MAPKAADVAAEEEPEEVVIEPVPPLAAEEYDARLQLFNDVFVECKADALKLASIKERTPAAPAEKAEGEEAGEEDAGAADAYAQAVQKAKSLMYGEVPFQILHDCLNEIKSQEMPLFPSKGLFTDLGAGAGKSCVAAALLHPFEKVVGVETLQCLVDAGAAALAKYSAAEFILPEGVPKPEVALQKGDFVAEFEGILEPIAGQTMVALAVATTYIADQMQAISTFANKMPDGSYFIAIGQGLPDDVTFGLNRHPLQRRAVAVKKALAVRGSDPDKIEIPEPTVYDAVGWVEVSAKEVEMDWGTSKCFVYKKIPNPFFEGWAQGPADGRTFSAPREGPWPQLKDLPKDEALAKLKEARADLQVELVESTAEAPAGDPNPERVLIKFDPDTGLVTEPPICG
jgi:hypothetical protein